ncbi:uncharacterized protein [Primulina huaijiensis]|uniref:uncharacterized protein n=1 Tax=Primulina huaijiensis TaxID=1492673 RepID=UPI003CC745CA
MDPFTERNPSLFPLETCPPVTDEAFNLFHSIDRELYTRLIQNLGREPVESLKVMAFWMWLEREGGNKILIRRMLSLPLALLNELADETVTCLKCVENDKYLFVNGNDQINLLPELLCTRVSLRFFHENRITVEHGVSKIITTVCLRAFNDILRRVLLENSAGYEGGESSRAAERRNNPLMMYHPHLNVPPFYPPPPPPPPPPLAAHNTPTVVDAYGIPVHMLARGGFPGGYDSELQRQMLSDELGDLLSRNLLLEINGEFEEKVLPDDRTIFLTFSKGYPITEAEVREFFTKRFGDFIEDLIMQEVGEDEQVLYARMVARSAAVIEPIVGGNKAKYSINGKHVWARKYVKRLQQMSLSSSTRSPPRVEDLSPSDQAGQGSTLP